MRTLLKLSILAGCMTSLSVNAETNYEEAIVLSSSPIFRTERVSVPDRQCWLEEVATRQSHPRRREHRSRTPDLLGAVIGGAIGNELGHNKSNQRVGAVVGAILGGSIARDLTRGNESQYNDRSAVRYETVERCEVVHHYEEEQKLVGYDVLYSYNGRDYTARMPHDPGSSVRVRVDVEPVLY